VIGGFHLWNFNGTDLHRSDPAQTAYWQYLTPLIGIQNITVFYSDSSSGPWTSMGNITCTQAPGGADGADTDTGQTYSIPTPLAITSNLRLAPPTQRLATRQTRRASLSRRSRFGQIVFMTSYPTYF